MTDYGYGDSQPDTVDYGYGDDAPTSITAPATASNDTAPRRPRRMSYGYSGMSTDDGSAPQPARRSNRPQRRSSTGGSAADLQTYRANTKGSFTSKQSESLSPNSCHSYSCSSLEEDAEESGSRPIRSGG
jgi:hypothetical protein